MSYLKRQTSYESHISNWNNNIDSKNHHQLRRVISSNYQPTRRERETGLGYPTSSRYRTASRSKSKSRRSSSKENFQNQKSNYKKTSLRRVTSNQTESELSKMFSAFKLNKLCGSPSHKRAYSSRDSSNTGRSKRFSLGSKLDRSLTLSANSASASLSTSAHAFSPFVSNSPFQSRSNLFVKQLQLNAVSSKEKNSKISKNEKSEKYQKMKRNNSYSTRPNSKQFSNFDISNATITNANYNTSTSILCSKKDKTLVDKYINNKRDSTNTTRYCINESNKNTTLLRKSKSYTNNITNSKFDYFYNTNISNTSGSEREKSKVNKTNFNAKNYVNSNSPNSTNSETSDTDNSEYSHIPNTRTKMYNKYNTSNSISKYKRTFNKSNEGSETSVFEKSNGSEKSNSKQNNRYTRDRSPSMTSTSSGKSYTSSTRSNISDRIAAFEKKNAEKPKIPPKSRGTPTGRSYDVSSVNSIETVQVDAIKKLEAKKIHRVSSPDTTSESESHQSSSHRTKSNDSYTIQKPAPRAVNKDNFLGRAEANSTIDTSSQKKPVTLTINKPPVAKIGDLPKYKRTDLSYPGANNGMTVGGLTATELAEIEAEVEKFKIIGQNSKINQKSNLKSARAVSEDFDYTNRRLNLKFASEIDQTFTYPSEMNIMKAEADEIARKRREVEELIKKCEEQLAVSNKNFV